LILCIAHLVSISLISALIFFYFFWSTAFLDFFKSLMHHYVNYLKSLWSFKSRYSLIFLLAVTLLCPKSPGKLCFHFHLLLGILWFILLFLDWLTDHSKVKISVFMCFNVFYSLSWYWVLVLIHCGLNIGSYFNFLIRL
jgi:hypothetical protein